MHLLKKITNRNKSELLRVELHGRSGIVSRSGVVFAVVALKRRGYKTTSYWVDWAEDEYGRPYGPPSEWSHLEDFDAIHYTYFTK